MVATFEPKSEYKVIGTRPIRHDGLDKVTGRAIYGADIKLPGMLWGAVLRSPHAHARISSIDTSAAEAMEGVVAVVTNADLPAAENKMVDLGEGATNLKWAVDNILASDKALYAGHAVAAVAAVDRYTAEEATRAIKVDYQPLRSATNVDDTVDPDMPAILDEFVGLPVPKRVDTPTTSRSTRTSSVTRTVLSARLTSSRKLSTRCRWCTRGTSSRTTQLQFGTKTVGSKSGRAHKAHSPFGSK